MNLVPGFADIDLGECRDLAQPLGFGTFHLIIQLSLVQTKHQVLF